MHARLAFDERLVQIFLMNILDKIVEQKKIEVAKLPARLIAAGDLRDAMLERGESRPENQKSQHHKVVTNSLAAVAISDDSISVLTSPTASPVGLRGRSAMAAPAFL